jgi:hypothetical protein
MNQWASVKQNFGKGQFPVTSQVKYWEPSYR